MCSFISCMYIHPFIHPPISLPIQPSVFLTFTHACLVTYFPIMHMSVFCICLPIYLYLSVCLSVCLSIYLSIYLSISIYPSKYLYQSTYLSVHLSACLYVCMSMCLYLSIHPSIHLFQDDKKWECHKCTYKSNIKGNLRMHLKKIHKIEVPTQRHLIQDPSNIIVGRTNVRLISPNGKTRKRPKTGREQLCLVAYW